MLGGVVALLFAAVATRSAPGCTIFDDATLEASSAASSSSSGTGDAGDDAGPPTAHYLDLTDAAKVCLLLGKCEEPYLRDSVVWSTGLSLDPFNFSQCLTWLAGPVAPEHPGLAYQRGVFECLAKLSSCDVTSCLNTVFYPPGDPSCDDAPDGGSGDFCGAPTIIQYCDPNFEIERVNCADPAFGKGAKCDAATTTPDCAVETSGCTSPTQCVDGSVLDICQDGVRTNFDCTSIGTRCGIDPSSEVFACLTDGKIDDCTDSTTKCTSDEQRVRMCNVDNNAVTYDCKAIGAACDSGPSEAFCHAPGDECTPFDGDVNTCSGKSLTVCIGGGKVMVDCGTIGAACSGSAGTAVCK